MVLLPRSPGWRVLVFGLALVLAGLATVEAANNNDKAIQCCMPGYALEHSEGHCYRADGNLTAHIQLHCNETYLIDPAEEPQLFVDEEGNLIDGAYTIPKQRFCVGHYEDSESDKGVFIVCFDEEDEEAIATMLMAKGILLLVSVVFLAVTLYIYLIIPDLRETQDKVTSVAVVCLMGFMFLLSVIQLWAPLVHTPYCSTMAFVMYFFLISYFAWLNMVMANVWKLTVARRWKIKERSWYILNHIYAFTIALTLSAMVYIYHSRYPTFGEVSCWFRTEREQSFFVYLPLSVMLSINIFLFVWTSIHLHTSGDDMSPDRKKALRYKCMLYLKLFLLSGLLWIFEILSFHIGEGIAPQSWFWIMVDSVNCLHGVLIFFVLIVWRQRIKRELANRWICCFRGPAHWAQLKDDEQEQLQEDGPEATKYDLIIK
uniref:Putative g protein-coupled receptor n=2 Tax=Anopheles triannulatus TaxID=58253 RepID=A0A2M4A0Q9_9DIPT